MAAQSLLTIATPARATSLVFAGSGALAAAVCGDHKLRVWTLPDARLVRTMDLTTDDNDLTVMSRDGRWIATGDHHGNVALWDSSNGQAVMRMRVPPYPGAGAFSHDGKVFALAPMGEPVQVFDVAAKRKLFELERPVGGTNSIAFSRDDSRLATVDGDTVVRIYDARTGKLAARNEDSLVEPFAIDFTADGKHAVAAGGDKVVMFLDAATGKALRRMDRTAEPAVVLAVSPDGKALATMYMKVDNMLLPAPVVIWDAAADRRLAEWMPPSVPVGGGWTQDGRLLIATATKDAVQIWRVR
jgi:WD40 repeat protein